MKGILFPFTEKIFNKDKIVDEDGVDNLCLQFVVNQVYLLSSSVKMESLLPSPPPHTPQKEENGFVFIDFSSMVINDHNMLLLVGVASATWKEWLWDGKDEEILILLLEVFLKVLITIWYFTWHIA